jgi:hypothetical protein
MLNSFQKGTIFGAALAALVFAFAFSTIPQPERAQYDQETTDVDARHHENESIWFKIKTDPVDLLTLGLLVVATAQAALFVWQLGLIQSGLKDTKHAAEAALQAANIARQEFNATHRPKIRIHFIEFRRVPHKGDDDWDRIGARFLCFNIGEAPAQTIEVRGEIKAVADLPINVQRLLIKTLPVVVSGEKFIFDIHSDWLVRELVSREKQGLPSFKCMGTIVYSDGNGTRRETAFCRELNISASGESWVKVGGPQYEYEY